MAYKREKKKCSPKAVYLLKTMGWSVDKIAKAYGVSKNEIRVKIALVEERSLRCFLF